MVPDKKARKKRAGVFPGLLFIVFFGATALVFAWKIADYLIDEHKSLDYWGELQHSVIITDATDAGRQDEDRETEYSPVTDKPEPGGENVQDAGKEVPFSVDFDKLRAISGNVVAWLFAPDTKINYVVAQSDDNAYYLRHLLDGTAADGGTLFEDYRCSADFSGWNTVIYGHQMNNGTMFGSLENYRNPAYYAEHPVMYLYTPEKRYTLELIAGYTTDVNDMIYNLPASKGARDELLAKAVKKSSFISGVTVGDEEKLVTLSTCSYVYDNARYVVIGRLVEN